MPVVLRKRYRECIRHVTLFLSSFLDEKSSDEKGGIRRRVNTSSIALFKRKGWGCTCKNSKGHALTILWV